MAGDWIKMRIGLPRDPHVAGIVRKLSASNADLNNKDIRKLSASNAHHMSAPCPTTYGVVGALHAVWSLFDEQSVDGKLPFFTPDDLDGLLQWRGFSAAMISVDWLEYKDNSLSMHNFNAHNGSSARRRSLESLRKFTVRKMSASNADTNGAKRPHPMRLREIEKREDLRSKASAGAPRTPAPLKFTPPTHQQVAAYIAELKAKIDPGQFLDYYASNGWRVGKSPMRDWKATIRRWQRTEGKENGRPSKSEEKSQRIRENIVKGAESYVGRRHVVPGIDGDGS